MMSLEVTDGKAITEDQDLAPGGAVMRRPMAVALLVTMAGVGFFALQRRAALLQWMPQLLEVLPRGRNRAIEPAPAGWPLSRHEENLAVTASADPELLLLGDSLTDFWRDTAGPTAGAAALQRHFGNWRIVNFGISGDATQGLLWRLQNGEGRGFAPRAVMLMIGTNNIGHDTVEEIGAGVAAVVQQVRLSFPQARVLLLGVLPRASARAPVRRTVAALNQRIAKLDDGHWVFYRDIGALFTDADGNIPAALMSDGIHPGPQGYEVWAQAVAGPLADLMVGQAPR
ncbi:MAG: GDSL-type esterase/lipase family protein [Steroidobacteraceae bacterium]